ADADDADATDAGDDALPAPTSLAPTGGGAARASALYRLRLTIGAARPLAPAVSSPSHRLRVGPAFTTSPR
ncbi:MAG: hypothetical protein KC635_20295, partial [Myxococcales bacterium]|nr:hypothetical protein [Myxococcales bacterium]